MRDIWKHVDDTKKNSNKSEVRAHIRMENIRKLIDIIFSIFIGFCMWIMRCIVNYGHYIG